MATMITVVSTRESGATPGSRRVPPIGWRNPQPASATPPPAAQLPAATAPSQRPRS